MKICSVIVTYGDRFHLLKQVIESCFREEIDKIIVIDNASAKESRRQLQKFEEENSEKLKVIYLYENIGSAGGYKKALEEAYKCKDCDYILPLDDDNVLPKNVKNKLKKVINYLNIPNNKFMLSMYRPIWNADRRVVYEGWVKGYKNNNFMGYNFFDIIKKRVFKLKKEKNYFPLHPIKVAAMGGLFFHKSVIDKIGFPKEELFLYADDHEYTYRFTKSGGKIFLCAGLIVKDIDETSKNDKGENINFFHKDYPMLKLYYSVRNHTYLSKKFITFSPFFYGNMGFVSFIYLKNFFKTSPKEFFKRYKLYLIAIKDGLNENLGKRL